jgi:hypothetical protein
MARITLRDQAANLPAKTRDELIESASNGESITSMVERLGVGYDVVQTLLWDEGTLPWQGAKSVISRRLKSLRAASRRADRDRLADELGEQVDYLYYAARNLKAQLDKVKALIDPPQR